MPGGAPLLPGPISYEEAEQKALFLGKSRGFHSRVEDGYLSSEGVWRLTVAVFRGRTHGRLLLDYDVRSGSLLREQEQITVVEGSDEALDLGQGERRPTASSGGW